MERLATVMGRCHLIGADQLREELWQAGVDALHAALVEAPVRRVKEPRAARVTRLQVTISPMGRCPPFEL